jgi:hypothetical protein
MGSYCEDSRENIINPYHTGTGNFKSSATQHCKPKFNWKILSSHGINTEYVYIIGILPVQNVLVHRNSRENTPPNSTVYMLLQNLLFQKRFRIVTTNHPVHALYTSIWNICRSPIINNGASSIMQLPSGQRVKLQGGPCD